MDLKNTHQRQDPYTGEMFVPKRSNQIYATPNNRITHNNEVARLERLKNAHIDKPIKNNIKILRKLMEGEDDKSFHIQFLKGKGFISNVQTGQAKFIEEIVPTLHEFLIIHETRNYVRIIRNN